MGVSRGQPAIPRTGGVLGREKPFGLEAFGWWACQSCGRLSPALRELGFSGVSQGGMKSFVSLTQDHVPPGHWMDSPCLN